jgi:ParB-like chromosome segregation protein Spo0J
MNPEQLKLIQQRFVEHLSDGKWVPESKLFDIIPEDLADAAASRPKYGSLPVARRLLTEEVVARLVEADKCEQRTEGEQVQVRLKNPPPQAAAEPTTPPAAPAGSGAGELPVHELAEVFPLMDGEEYKHFVEDLRVNGQQEDIITYQGQILDGRNRYRACKELGITPRTREWEGKGAPLAFVLSRNLHRRHLKESQRAMVAARLKPHFEEEAQQRMRTGKATPHPPLKKEEGRPREAAAQAAQRLGVSPDSVYKAQQILRDGTPELQRAVDAGQLRVSTAASLAQLPPEEQTEVVAAGKKEAVARAKQVRARKAKGKKSPDPGGAAPTNQEPEAAPTTGGGLDQDQVLTIRRKLSPEAVAQQLKDFLGQDGAGQLKVALEKLLAPRAAERAVRRPLGLCRDGQEGHN